MSDDNRKALDVSTLTLLASIPEEYRESEGTELVEQLSDLSRAVGEALLVKAADRPNLDLAPETKAQLAQFEQLTRQSDPWSE